LQPSWVLILFELRQKEHPLFGYCVPFLYLNQPKIIPLLMAIFNELHPLKNNQRFTHPICDWCEIPSEYKGWNRKE